MNEYDQTAGCAKLPTHEFTKNHPNSMYLVFYKAWIFFIVDTFSYTFWLFIFAIKLIHDIKQNKSPLPSNVHQTLD
jgi:hypothetical protein